MAILRVKHRRADGTEHIAYWVGVPWQGTRIRKRSPVQTQQGAARYEKLIRRTLATHGSLVPLEPIKPVHETTFAELIERWRRDHVDTIEKVSGRRTKETILRVHLVPHFGSAKLNDIDEGAIDRFSADLRRRGLHKKTVNNILTVLNTALSAGTRWNLQARRPTIKLHKVKSEDPRFLSVDEARTLVAAAPNGFWRTMIATGIATGMRISELLALEWRDVDLAQRHIRVRRAEVLGVTSTPKDGDPRTIPLGAEVVEFLARLPRGGPRVFQLPPLRSPYMYTRRRLRTISRAAGIYPPIAWHALRHTYATLSIQAGVPLNVVKQIMGHESIETTNQYIHLVKSSLHDSTRPFPSLGTGQPADSEPAKSGPHGEDNLEEPPSSVPA